MGGIIERMNKDIPVPGQRWTSDTEPELGLGIVLKSEYGRAEIFFPAAGEHRQYALASAPIPTLYIDSHLNIRFTALSSFRFTYRF